MLTEADHDRVAAAIRAAEANTDGEIAVVVTPESDSYADAVLHWALLLGLLPLALAASVPALLIHAAGLFHPGWGDAPPLALMLGLLMAAAVLCFLAGRFLFAVPGIKQALIPHATKARRVRRRAIMIFRVGTEQRTATRTGVLLYLSLFEHRAEIVADQQIQRLIAGEEWGEAMAALLTGLKAGRPGDGIADAVAAIGAVLARHMPHSGRDPNELPDRMIQL
jgi:putative membrane protein